MNSMKLISLIALLLSTTAAFAQQNYLIIGTYDSPKSEGIYVYKFDSKDGTAKEVSHIKVTNPSFLTISKDEIPEYSLL